jgi:hypothetical protein
MHAPVIVKILPAVPGTPEAEESRREQNQKSAVDRGLLWFTAMLAVATFALVVATIGLVFSAKTGDGYNYDRLRVRGEGDDWHKNA